MVEKREGGTAGIGSVLESLLFGRPAGCGSGDLSIVADGRETVGSLVEQFGIVDFLPGKRVNLMAELDFSLEFAELAHGFEHGVFGLAGIFGDAGEFGFVFVE